MTLKLRQERKRLDWTLKYVAEEIGLSIPAVHDIETGRRKPSYEVLIKLLKLYGIPIHEKIEQLFGEVSEGKE